MEALARVSWLFVRGAEAIRVNYAARTLSVAANGPGHDRRVFKFGDEETAAEFLKLYEYFLTGGGWVLQAFVERRSEQPGAPTEEGERRG
jgi:hypothetical protein